MNPTKIKIPPEAAEILTVLESAGYESYIVGGCVRDALMCKPAQDFDITTAAGPAQIKGLFRRTIDTGIKHGTVSVLLRRRVFEVTTFRIDGEYLDKRRPRDVRFTQNIAADLARRDFTMNAIAYSPARGLLDPFGGTADIAAKIIRCVGAAEERFAEDALRMLRALRFASQLGFALEPATFAAIAPIAAGLCMVSMERVRIELTKLLAGENPNLPLLEETGLWPHILRGLDTQINLTRCAALVRTCPKEPPLLYALLLHCETAPRIKAFMEHLRFDNRTAKQTALYVSRMYTPFFPDSYEIKKALSALGEEGFEKLQILRGILTSTLKKEILARAECYRPKDLAVTGDDLLAAGVPPGKSIGIAKTRILDAVMRDPALNSRQKILNSLVDMQQ